MHSISEFLQDQAKQLIFDFEKNINTSHPGEKGSIGETTSKKSISNCLPNFISINSGFVIDSFGTKSKQTDLILHETSCPSFSLGPETEYKYFPCEGVCAIGEVKTNIGKKELEDCYAKVKSVISLKRNPLSSSFRRYGSTLPTYGGEDGKMINPENVIFQIFSFVLCKSIKVEKLTFMNLINDFDKEFQDKYVPSVFVSLDDGIFIRVSEDSNSRSISYDIKKTNFLHHIDFGIDNFPFLIHMLTRHIQDGHTTSDSPIIPYLSKFNDLKSTVRLKRNAQ